MSTDWENLRPDGRPWRSRVDPLMERARALSECGRPGVGSVSDTAPRLAELERRLADAVSDLEKTEQLLALANADRRIQRDKVPELIAAAEELLIAFGYPATRLRAALAAFREVQRGT